MEFQYFKEYNQFLLSLLSEKFIWYELLCTILFFTLDLISNLKFRLLVDLTILCIIFLIIFKMYIFNISVLYIWNFIINAKLFLKYTNNLRLLKKINSAQTNPETQISAIIFKLDCFYFDIFLFLTNIRKLKSNTPTVKWFIQIVLRYNQISLKTSIIWEKIYFMSRWAVYLWITCEKTITTFPQKK